MQNLGWALVTTGVLGVVLWALSRVVYYLGIIPIAQTLSRLSRGMSWPYYALLMPGTVLHEFSHWIVCKATLVRVVEFVPFSPRRDGTLGWVLHEPAGPVRSQMIGLAPIFGGVLALYLSARVLVPGLLAIAAPDQIYATPAESLWSVGASWLTALTGADYHHWATWLFLYVAFVVGRGMMPSPPDLWQLLGGVTVAIGTAFLVGLADVWLGWGVTVHPLAVRMAGVVLPLVHALNALLAFATVTVALGAAVLVPAAMAMRRLGAAPSPGPHRAPRRGARSVRRG